MRPNRALRIWTPALLLLAASACAPGPPPVSEEVRRLNGVDLFVKTVGRGEPIVVVHGGPGMDHTYFLPGLAPLAESHQLVFYDQRGGGRSGGALDPDSLSLEIFLADLDALRADLGLDRMHLFGHSFGGFIAMAYAVDYPDRVRTLILSNPTEPGQRYAAQTAANQAERRTEADAAALAALRESEGFQTRDPAVVAEMFRVNFLATFHDRANAERLNIEFTPRGAEAVFAVGAALFGGNARLDLWDDLHRVDVPVLIVHGRSDPLPAAMVRELGDTFPEATVRFIDGAGHFPFVEAPEPYFDAIRSFLDAR